jgi:hypothetical protein
MALGPDIKKSFFEGLFIFFSKKLKLKNFTREYCIKIHLGKSLESIIKLSTAIHLTYLYLYDCMLHPEIQWSNSF